MLRQHSPGPFKFYEVKRILVNKVLGISIVPIHKFIFCLFTINA